MRFAAVAVVMGASWMAVGQGTDGTARELEARAHAAVAAKHYDEGARLYQRALQQLDNTEGVFLEYNLACAQARLGQREEALASLGRAIDAGYGDRKETEADDDLISLHTDPRWAGLMERMGSLGTREEARWGDAAFAAVPAAANLSDAAKMAGLSELWAQAKYGFANFWHVPALQWDQTYLDFIPQVLATRSTEEYYRVLERFYALLQDGHTNVYSPELIGGKMDRLPLRTRLVDGRVLVMGARDPKADLQGIRVGDEVTTVNGEPVRRWAEREVLPYVSSSSEQDRMTRTYEYLLFLAPLGTQFTLGMATPGGATATHTFAVKASEDRQQREPFVFRMMDGGIAYVAMNEFEDDAVVKGWDAHWSEIAAAKAVVLDVRENGGGSDNVGDHVFATLIDRTVSGELARSTRWVASYKAWGRPETPVRFEGNTIEPDAKRHFGGPVVVLTSPRTFSAGEDLVVNFAQAHRGKTVGEATGGSSGQPLLFKLPGGGMARVCTKHDSFADGREFVGVGVVPDVPAHLSREDVVSGRDSVLERGVAVAREMAAKP